jgi:MarR family transcriptional regulator, lower aerobic nicotinate degradation pathway regulator
MISYLPLIEKWETYLQAGGTQSMEHFAVWLLQQKQQERQVADVLNEPGLQAYFDQNGEENLAFLSSEAAYLVGRLYKYVRNYTKPILSAAGLSSQDEFAILAHADFLGECTKKVAIEDNLIDTTTGIDAIRRLVNKGLLQEKVNATDRRERLISLTQSGKAVLQQVYLGFAGIQDVLADLDHEERQQLVMFLKSLDDFHGKLHQKAPVK